jgi:hypothetical protein
MHTYVVYDRFTGEVLNFAVCPGPFEVSEAFIEALVETGNLDRVSFIEVDPRAAIPRVVDPHSPSRVTTPPAAPQAADPIDYERVA